MCLCAPPLNANGDAALSGGAAAAADETLLLVPCINDIMWHSCARILRRGSRLYVPAEELASWGLRVPDTGRVVHEGQHYVPLDLIPGLSHEVDTSRQELLIRSTAESFRPQSIESLAAPRPAISPGLAGGFFNYDLQWLQADAERSVGGLFEAGASGAGITATSTALWRDGSLLRLDSALTRDDPDGMTRLQLGDAITDAGAWGRPVRFGGLRWGTDLGLRPGFIAYPLPTLRGETALPSVAEVYVNNVRLLGTEVGPGRFELTQIPVVNGHGVAALAVTDALGRTVHIEQRYYLSPALLKPGLHDFTFAAGLAREDYGARSNAYGRALGVIQWRTGISERLTGEWRAEAQRAQFSGGATGTYLFPHWGTAEAGAALSAGARGRGAMLLLGAERKAPAFSFGVHAELADGGFTALGMAPTQSAPRLRGTLHLGVPAGARATLSLSHVVQDFRDHADTAVSSLSYSTRLGQHLHLSAFVIRAAIDRDTDHLVALVLTLPLAARTTASLHASRQGGGGDTFAQLQRSAPEGPGLGYRVLAGRGPHGDRQQAELTLQTGVGTYQLDAARVDDLHRIRAGARGGIAVIGREIHLTRELHDSFAVVEVGDYADVRVYAENRTVGRTDRHGRLLVTGLRAYDSNRLGIEQADLPIDATVQTLSTTVAPPYRSGIRVAFPAQPTRGATLEIVLQNGEPLPLGSTVTAAAGDGTHFPVGWNGEAFVTGLSHRGQLIAHLPGGRCRIDYRIPPDAGPLPRLGPLLCREEPWQ